MAQVTDWVTAVWLAASTLIFVWFGLQAILTYWNSDVTSHKSLEGRRRLVYLVGAVLVWGGMATFVLLALYGLVRFWFNIIS